MTPTKPLRLTPPQIHALRLLRDGWQCVSAGPQPPERFGNLLWYALTRQDQKTVYAAGTTLTSLQRRGWIAYEPAALTLTYDDGSTYEGYRLVLTEAGAAVAATL